MDLPLLYPQHPVYSCSQFDTTFKDTIDFIYPDYTGTDCGENDTWTFLHISQLLQILRYVISYTVLRDKKTIKISCPLCLDNTIDLLNKFCVMLRKDSGEKRI